MKTVHIYRSCCIALARGIRDRERRPQLESHAWSVQVTCLVIVVDSVGASRSRIEIAGGVVYEGSKGKGIGIKDGWSKSPMFGLAKA